MEIESNINIQGKDAEKLLIGQGAEAVYLI